MKKIEAFIRHEAFEPIRTELLDKGFPSLSILEAKGSGRQKGIVEHYRGSTLTVNVRPKLKIEVVVDDKDKGLVVETILKHARTGDVGDGKIFVIPGGGGDSHPHRRGRTGGAPSPRGGGDPRLGGCSSPLRDSERAGLRRSRPGPPVRFSGSRLAPGWLPQC